MEAATAEAVLAAAAAVRRRAAGLACSMMEPSKVAESREMEEKGT